MLASLNFTSSAVAVLKLLLNLLTKVAALAPAVSILRLNFFIPPAKISPAFEPTTPANMPKAAIALDKLPDMKSAMGANPTASRDPNLSPRLITVAANFSKDSAVVLVEMSTSLNFLVPSSITALANACLRSKLVSELAERPTESAYFLTAGSIRVKIPSSSNSSGSSLAAPRDTRVNASVRDLPKALEALRDTSESFSICVVLNPAARPIFTVCAVSKRLS